MKSSDLVSSFAEIAHAKDIDRETLQLIIQDVFRAMIRKHYGADDPKRSTSSSTPTTATSSCCTSARS